MLPPRPHPALVRQRLALPALALLFTGLIALGAALVIALWYGLHWLTESSTSDAIVEGIRLAIVGGLLLADVLVALVILAGAGAMMRMRYYPIAWLGAVLAAMPLHIGFFPGMAAGIWALVVLTRHGVRDAFDNADDETSGPFEIRT
jgi:hypothetical protein